jgi:hypothetical protein
VLIFDGRQQVARHDRLTGRLEAHLELDQYLEALIRKPGALPGATALEQALAAAGTRVNNVRKEHNDMARIIDHSADPSKAARSSQTWALFDPVAFQKLLKHGAIRRAEPAPCPAPGRDGGEGHFEWHVAFYGSGPLEPEPAHGRCLARPAILVTEPDDRHRRRPTYSPLLASLIRGTAPLDSEVYQSDVVVVGRLRTAPPKESQEEEDADGEERPGNCPRLAHKVVPWTRGVRWLNG